MKTILQIEDDQNDAFLVAHSLHKIGVTNPIQLVADGQQAINYLQGAGKYCDRTQYPLPDLILLDLKLPRVMGLEVLRWIRRQAGLPMIVVVLTASSEESDIAAAYEFGANAFLTKPTQASRLDQMLKATTDFWLTCNTPPEESSPESPMEGVVSLVRSTQPAQLLEGLSLP